MLHPGRLPPDAFSLPRPARLLWAVGFLAGFAASTFLLARPARAAVVVNRLQAVAPEIRLGGTREKPPAEAVELLQAIEQFDKQDFDRCWELLNAARKKHPQLPPARLMLARLFLSRDLTPPGRVALEQAAREEPDYPGVYLSFGELALTEARFTDAFLHFEHAMELVEKGKWAQGEASGFRLRALGGLASVAERRQDWQTARTRLVAWVELDPNDASARRRFAAALFHCGDPQGALAQFEQAARDDPASEPPNTAMAWLYTRRGELDQAAKWMERALAAAPKDPRTRAEMAAWLLWQRRTKEAGEHADVALTLGAPSREVRLVCASLARHRRDFSAAESHLEPLVRADADDLDASNQLALVLIEQADEGRRQRALEIAQRVAAQQPRSAEALSTLGWVYYRLNRRSEAEPALRGCQLLGAPAPDNAYYLACLLNDLGQTAEAKSLLEQAMAARGAFVNHDEAKKLLQRMQPGPAAGAQGDSSIPAKDASR